MFYLNRNRTRLEKWCEVQNNGLFQLWGRWGFFRAEVTSGRPAGFASHTTKPFSSRFSRLYWRWLFLLDRLWCTLCASGPVSMECLHVKSPKCWNASCSAISAFLDCLPWDSMWHTTGVSSPELELWQTDCVRGGTSGVGVPSFSSFIGHPFKETQKGKLRDGELKHQIDMSIQHTDVLRFNGI